MSLRPVLFCWICLGVFVTGCGTASQENKKDYPKAQVIGHGTQGSGWLGMGVTIPLPGKSSSAHPPAQRAQRMHNPTVSGSADDLLKVVAGGAAGRAIGVFRNYSGRGSCRRGNSLSIYSFALSRLLPSRSSHHTNEIDQTNQLNPIPATRREMGSDTL